MTEEIPNYLVAIVDGFKQEKYLKHSKVWICAVSDEILIFSSTEGSAVVFGIKEHLGCLLEDVVTYENALEIEGLHVPLSVKNLPVIVGNYHTLSTADCSTKPGQDL